MNLQAKHQTYFPSNLESFAVLTLLFQFFVGAQCHLLRIPLKLSSKLLNEAVLEQRPGQSDHVIDANLRGSPGQGYYMQMAVGTPPQLIEALVDTGSSNFAIAAAPHEDIEKYFNTSVSQTLVNLGTEVSVPYTQGDWKGFLGQDVVGISESDNMSNVTAYIAFITESDHFFINGSHWEGILGLAYRSIARPGSYVEPYFDSLVQQMGISDIFSLHLCGLNSVAPHDTMVGSLILGGVDSTLYNGTIEYVHISKEWYYEVIITDITVGETSLQMDCKEYNFDKTIVDSGTTNLRLPTRVYNAVVDQLIIQTRNLESISSQFWKGLDILCWRKDEFPWEDFPLLILSLAASRNTSLDLVVSPRNYLRQISNHDATSYLDEVCYKFSVAASDSGSVIGAVVMEGFYTIFDRQNKRLGFANTICPELVAASTISYIMGPRGNNFDGFDCGYTKPEWRSNILPIATAIMGAVCVLCVIPLVVLVIRWQILRCRLQRQQNDQSNLLNEPER